MKISSFAGFLAASLLLASCATATLETENLATETAPVQSAPGLGPETETPGVLATETGVEFTQEALTPAPQENQAGQPPQAVQAAVAMLSQAINVGESQVQVVSYEQEQWPDSCLGLADPGEMCLQVITPGWSILLDAGGKRYEIHTDETGSRLRIKEL